MKNFSKLMITALVLAGVSGKLAAYSFNIKNKTGNDAKVKLFWGAGSTLVNWKEIKKGKSRRLSARNLNCLNGIKVQRKEIIELDGQRIGEWLRPEGVRLVRPQVPWIMYPVAGVVSPVAGFVEAGFQCGNQNFDLEIDNQGKVVAIKK